MFKRDFLKLLALAGLGFTALTGMASAQMADSIDAPVMYLDGPDYLRYVQGVYRQETDLIQKLDLKELMLKG